MRRWLILACLVIAVIGVGLFPLSLGNLVVLELTWNLLFGWIGYALRVFPKVQPTAGGFITAGVCLAVLGLGLHAFLGWLYGNLGRVEGQSPPPERRWRARWTASLLTVTVFMFVAGISATGALHQVLWIARDRGHLTERRGDPWREELNLKNVGLGIVQTGTTKGIGLPSAAIWSAEGLPLHGWMTAILPYMGVITSQIDLAIPWNDPRNAENFKTFIPDYLHPAIRVYRDAEGYGLSHYAGNVHVFKRKPVAPASLPNGASNTLLVGEVAGHFQAWGRPLTERDPTAGLNTTPDGFASPTGDAVMFIFADGSVRSVRASVDPEVLRRLSGRR